MSLDAAQLSEVLIGAGVSSATWSLADRQYALPTRQWVLGPFSAALAKLQFEFQVNHWTAEDNDCDDFARLAAAFAQCLHTNTRNHPASTALAVGEVWYLRDSGGGHAINFAVCGNAPEDVMFYEPQSMKEVSLSASERGNIINIRA